MRPTFVPFPTALVLATTLAIAGTPATIVSAGSPYLLHVQISGGESRHGLDVAVPWDLDHRHSPFDFTDCIDRPKLQRLRTAWSVLHRLPEGRTVTIEGDHGDTRAWLEHGDLVLQPLDDRSDHDSRVRIPGEIVDALLHRDGRLTNADLGEMLRTRNRIALVEVGSDEGHIRVWIGRDAD